MSNFNITKIKFHKETYNSENHKGLVAIYRSFDLPNIAIREFDDGFVQIYTSQVIVTTPTQPIWHVFEELAERVNSSLKTHSPKFSTVNRAKRYLALVNSYGHVSKEQLVEYVGE